MARETKVGLLAGLAFVICFAVILTNKGSDAAALPAPSVLSDAGTRVAAALQQGPAQALDDRQFTGPAAPSAGSRPELRFLDPATEPRSNSGYAFDPQGRIPSSTAPDRSDPDAQTMRERPLAASVLVERGTPPLAPPLPQSVGDAAPPASTPPSARAYTVTVGDTLSKIALAQYGNKSPATVQAIFEANRAVLDSSDLIRPGMTLNLPELARSESAARHAAAKPAERPQSVDSKSGPARKPAEPADAAARWYQIRKNDRWASIAREQLGDASRWKELHALNKDKFPEPDKIREGVRIKLPPTKVLASAGGLR